LHTSCGLVQPTFTRILSLRSLLQLKVQQFVQPSDSFVQSERTHYAGARNVLRLRCASDDNLIASMSALLVSNSQPSLCCCSSLGVRARKFSSQAAARRAALQLRVSLWRLLATAARHSKQVTLAHSFLCRLNGHSEPPCAASRPLRLPTSSVQPCRTATVTATSNQSWTQLCLKRTTLGREQPNSQSHSHPLQACHHGYASSPARATR
jgi:hypothetical protein